MNKRFESSGQRRYEGGQRRERCRAFWNICVRLRRSGKAQGWSGLLDEARRAMLAFEEYVGGAVAQLGARLDGIEEVVGSNPISSTKIRRILLPSILEFAGAKDWKSTRLNS